MSWAKSIAAGCMKQRPNLCNYFLPAIFLPEEFIAVAFPSTFIKGY